MRKEFRYTLHFISCGHKPRLESWGTLHGETILDILAGYILRKKLLDGEGKFGENRSESHIKQSYITRDDIGGEL